VRYCDDGWLPDPPSKYKPFAGLAVAGKRSLAECDLRIASFCRHDQGSTRSCVAQAVAKALEVKRVLQYGPRAHRDLSRMALWYLGRELCIPKTNRQNTGTYIWLVCDVLRRFGAALEEEWEWDESLMAVAPSWGSMRQAYLHKITGYYRITSRGQQRVDDCITALNAGEPVVFGTATGDNWQRYQSGQVLGLPQEETGRHATVLMGWVGGRFVGENSWGRKWGDDGFYTMDPAVVASALSEDFWVLQCGWEE